MGWRVPCTCFIYIYGIFWLGTFKPLLNDSVFESPEQDVFGSTQFCKNICWIRLPLQPFDSGDLLSCQHLADSGNLPAGSASFSLERSGCVNCFDNIITITQSFDFDQIPWHVHDSCKFSLDCERDVESLFQRDGLCLQGGTHEPGEPGGGPVERAGRPELVGDVLCSALVEGRDYGSG